MPLFLRHLLWLAMICAWCVHNSHQPQMPNQIIKFVVRKCALLTHLRLWCVNSPVVTLNNKKTSTPRLCSWFFCSHFHFGCRLFNPDENKKKFCMLTERSPQKPKLDYSPGRLLILSLCRRHDKHKKVYHRRNHGNFVLVREHNLPFWCG